MRVTLLDVAQHCGVSRATVSLVLQDSMRVSEKTKNRVREAMADMGYVYDRRAANLRSRRTSGFGLVLTDIHNPALADLAMSSEDAAGAAGCSMMMGFTRDDLDRQNQILQAVMEYRLDGLVLSPATGTTVDHLTPLVTGGMPVVLVTRRLYGLPCDYAGPDNAMGGRLIADHLAAIGARSVALVGGSVGVTAQQERLRGLSTQWEKLGLRWNPDLAIPTNALESGGREGVRRLVQLPSTPDAIVCYSDTVARGVYTELRRHGLRPGEDVAVVGFDNDPTVRHLYPPLTSTDTHMADVGTEAIRLLLSKVADPLRDHETTLLPSELHERESTRTWGPRGAGL